MLYSKYDSALSAKNLILTQKQLMFTGTYKFGRRNHRNKNGMVLLNVSIMAIWYFTCKFYWFFPFYVYLVAIGLLFSPDFSSLTGDLQHSCLVFTVKGPLQVLRKWDQNSLIPPQEESLDQLLERSSWKTWMYVQFRNLFFLVPCFGEILTLLWYPVWRDFWLHWVSVGDLCYLESV
jgi:hypothetical protein